MKFPDQGTTIAAAIEQGTSLFKAFDFLEASGNLLILFTDGQDTAGHAPRQERQRDRRGREGHEDSDLHDPPRATTKGSARVLPDDIWKPAIEATRRQVLSGGRRGRRC